MKITFLNYDGTVLTESDCSVGVVKDAPEGPNKDGYIFLGWVPTIEMIPTKDCVYYPTYKPDCDGWETLCLTVYEFNVFDETVEINWKSGDNFCSEVLTDDVIPSMKVWGPNNKVIKEWVHTNTIVDEYGNVKHSYSAVLGGCRKKNKLYNAVSI